MADGDNKLDDGVDEELFGYVDLDNPQSFLLFAGAGSGKTRSLVNILARIRTELSHRLWLRRQRVRVITYTKAACDEINRRFRFDPIVEVSTIHSFCWSLIGNFNNDIREWLRTRLIADIAELDELIAKGRPGTKAAAERALSLASKERRLARLDEITKFTYSPTGDNRGRDSLNHAEVVALAAAFLTDGSILASILINQYPILLIDESQDTNRQLMEALLAVQAAHRSTFCLGLFGDMMQRIYTDGKAGLAEALGEDWKRPAKVMNHRCPPRVVELINKVREADDGQQQRPRADKAPGTVRLFVLPTGTANKAAAEATIAAKMAEVANDPAWSAVPAGYKALTLEHHMAARRAGFLEMFEPLYTSDLLKTGLLDGSLPGLRLFSEDVLPLMIAHRANDAFAIAAVVRQRSPLLALAALKDAGQDQPQLLANASAAVDELLSLWDTPEAPPTFRDVATSVAKSGLFELPDALKALVERDAVAQEEKHAAEADEAVAAEDEEDDVPRDSVLVAWDGFLSTPFEQIVAYKEYVSGRAPSATHQGVKGLEFPRVMVIMDDGEARGFLFSYDKLFGAKPKSETDQRNEREGGETSIDRTRRLFYVTCSRAEESLAVVAYSSDPAAVQRMVIEQRWFAEDEVEL
ncbi:MAG: UvrD-helicase domain-containing protein [Pseudomonadota bacterium]|uniref:UvrD-helicase domain-containing protein n=1 Tax=Phenylobacterium sp. TaxID=1871053 RepID=UPI0025EE4296|nr:UvrD-helicase domain-containing protein [Phenylobacterium sp.]MBT9471817.1 ATP-dependent helicase [Phenylobacterium sp.]